jgi:acetyl esterase/lipase
MNENKRRNYNEGALIQNEIYGPDAKNNRCDIFYPENLKGKNPTIIVIHGGAYIGGDIRSTRKLCKEFAQMGLIVFNFEYTKSDTLEQKYFPTPIYEFYDFYKHITSKRPLADLIDYDNIFLFGDSSGAHIATLITNIQTNDNLKFDYNLQGGPKIKGLILDCPSFGIYNFNNRYPKTAYHEVVFGSENKKNPLWEVSHNLDLLTNNLPPILMLSVKGDFVVGAHRKPFLEKAKELELNVEHYTISSGYRLFHSCMIGNIEYYPKCLKLMKNFIKKRYNNTYTPGVYDRAVYEDSKSPNIIEEKPNTNTK